MSYESAHQAGYEFGHTTIWYVAVLALLLLGPLVGSIVSRQFAKRSHGVAAGTVAGGMVLGAIVLPYLGKP